MARTVRRSFAFSLLFTTATAAALPAGDDSARTAMPATADQVGVVLDKASSEDRELASRLSALSSEAERLQVLLNLRGRSYVKLARAGLLPIGGGLDSLVEHASRLERLRVVLARDLARERQIAAERVQLAKQRETVADRLAVLSSERAALARSHTAILAAEERETAFRRAFLGQHDAPHTAVYSGMGPLAAGDLEAGFGAQKGRLPFPLEGRAEIRSARLASADGPGVEMIAKAGAAVHAVYPGRVAFADSYADYGRAVIVDHGSGYYTVSGNLAHADVAVGAEVRAGERIGTVATTERGTVLYFEVRRGAKTVNPSVWFGI
jgi:septal ring factor EnvC (AmiA/AmiB activator)